MAKTKPDGPKEAVVPDEGQMPETVKADPHRFSKSEILGFKAFANRRDIAAVALTDGKTYTVDDAWKAINRLLQRKVV